jgi:hypothetical protein
LAEILGEGVVALVSAFEPRHGDEWDPEMSGDGARGDVLGLSGRPQLAVVVDRGGSGQPCGYLPGDGSFDCGHLYEVVERVSAYFGDIDQNL